MEEIDFHNLQVGKTYFIEILDYGLRRKLHGKFIGHNFNNADDDCSICHTLCDCNITKNFQNIQLIQPSTRISIEENNRFGICRFKFYIEKKHIIQQNMEIRAIDKFIQRITGEQYFSYMKMF
jgi:hypothetical protein